jgi:hypothetical protein
VVKDFQGERASAIRSGTSKNEESRAITTDANALHISIPGLGSAEDFLSKRQVKFVVSHDPGYRLVEWAELSLCKMKEGRTRIVEVVAPSEGSLQEQIMPARQYELLNFKIIGPDLAEHLSQYDGFLRKSRPFCDHFLRYSQ